MLRITDSDWCTVACHLSSSPFTWRQVDGLSHCHWPMQLPGAHTDSVQAIVCAALVERMSSWCAGLPGSLAALPQESYENCSLNGHVITFATYKQSLTASKTLVVFQALVRTWSRPTFFSLDAVGRMYAEGLILADDGTVAQAPDDQLWAYR